MACAVIKIQPIGKEADKELAAQSRNQGLGLCLNPSVD